MTPQLLKRCVRWLLMGVAAALAVCLVAASPAMAVLNPNSIVVREGNQDNASLGYCVGTAGDVNGDGYSDVLLNTSAGNGTAWCYHGAASGVASSPAWTIAGVEGALNIGGGRLSTAGDVNGDGYDDVIVGMPLYQNEPNEGAVAVYLGSPSGLPTTPQQIIEGNSDLPAPGFGSALDAAGDVNGDGYDDIVVGSPTFTDAREEEGRACVYFGSPSGVEAAPWVYQSEAQWAHFGLRVAGSGDVNGDGFDDILVSAPDLSNGSNQEGRVYLFLGSASGPATTPSWTHESDVTGGRCGFGLGFAGDVNADGYSDIVFDKGTGNPTMSAALLYFGGALGPGTLPNRTLSIDRGSFADVIYTAGDVNGDGRADLIANDPSLNNNTGLIYILCETGVTLTSLIAPPGVQAGELFGADARPAGDVNGDGFGDVIVGAPLYDGGETNEGIVRIFLGRPSYPSPFLSWAGPGFAGNSDHGYSVAQGDWNGDGFSDIAAGAPYQDIGGGANRGQVVIYYGRATGWAGSPSLVLPGANNDAKFGYSVANAGDTNGDGYDDLIVGEPYKNVDKGAAHIYRGSATGLVATPLWTSNATLSGHFGWSVAGAGDVNADGYADVIVGMPDLENGFPIIRGGRAYLYLGSSAGPSQSASIAPNGSATGDQCGFSVAGAGDVNGDGYDDFMVGMPRRESESGQADEGFVCVYFGAPNGISGSWTVQGEQTGAKCGYSVSSAGDLNADGYGDIVIGAPNYDSGVGIDCGLAAAYLGGPNNTLALAWSQTGSNQADLLGFAVSGGGDVNNDGYSDIVVGAPLADSPINSGAAYLYLGRSNGVEPSPVWTGFHDNEDDQSQFGAAVSCAGDGTGDGFGDIVVGQPFAGASSGNVWGFYGGRQGLSPIDGGVSRLPRQFRTDGTTPIALGGMSNSQHEFEFSALGRSAKGRSLVRAEYEVARAGLGWPGVSQSGLAFDTGAPVSGAGSAVLVELSASGLPASATYHWRVRFQGDSPFFPHTPWFSIPGNGAGATDLRTAPGATGIADAGTPPTGASIAPRVGPNPCRDEATIWFSMPAAGRARISVFDVAGRRIARIVDRDLPSGPQEVSWDTRDADGRRVAAGLYLIRVEDGSARSTAKVVVRR